MSRQGSPKSAPKAPQAAKSPLSGQMATPQRLAELENTMIQVEEMLKEIEDVSSVIEFNVGAPSSGASEKGLFRAHGNGAAVLAQSVAEDLKKWHSKSEAHVVEYGAEHAERLRKSVQDQKAGQDSRELVREVVREHLYRVVSQNLQEHISEVVTAQAKLFKGKGVEIGNSIEAFRNLQSRLEGATSFLTNLQAEAPDEMVAGSLAARWAVQRKAERAVGRRQRLAEIETHLDENLLTDVEECMHERKTNLHQQAELQEETLKHLDATQRDRKASADEQLEPQAKLSDATRPGDGPWKMLRPAALQEASLSSLQRLAPTSGKSKPSMPQLSPALEQAIAATLTPQIQQQGKARLKELRSEFYSSYLAKDSGERSKQVGNELERWQLRSKIELLKEIQAVTQSNHTGIMDQLRLSLDYKSSGPTDDQFHRTMETAEAFHQQKNQFFDDQVDSAERAISDFCEQSHEQILSLRRRTELASLKRWNDVSEGLNLALHAFWMKCQWQLADEVRKALCECHKHVSLPVENLDVEKGRRQVELVSVAWKRSGTHTSQQLSFLESITKAVPVTVESCAVTKAAMNLLEEELERIINKLKAATELQP